MIIVAPVVLSLSLFAAAPVNYWELDETAGSTYLDSIGGADGTCTEPGCPDPILGIVNGAQDFNGTETDMITVPDTAGFDWGTDANVTIEFWMKSGALQVISDNDVMMGRTAGAIQWYIGIDGANDATLGHLRAYIIDGAAVSGNIPVNNDGWNHIAFVLKPGMVKVYVNGEYDFNITRTPTDLSFDTNVTFGNLNNSAGDWAYTGQLDDIKLYATDLNGSTIKEHYNDVVNPDLDAPILAEVTPVVSPTDDNTPNYTFSSNEAGTITYGGSCTSATTSATAGDNTITFDALADGLYDNCTITVTDGASNQSLPLAVTEFVVDTTAPVVPPVVDPVVPVDTPVTTTGGGGGCTYNPNSKNFDMTFLLMMALGLLYPFRRRFLK